MIIIQLNKTNKKTDKGTNKTKLQIISKYSKQMKKTKELYEKL